jgi:hypothetical protein
MSGDRRQIIFRRFAPHISLSPDICLLSPERKENRMTVATNSIRIRGSATNSVASLCETFNTLDALILATGMLAVPDSDVSGQSGTFVAGTPGDGETQIAALSATTGNALCGTKVYRHPSLGFCLRVNFYDSGYTTAQRFARVSYFVGTEVSGGDLAPSRLSDEIWPGTNITPVTQFTLTIIPATYTPIKASCGVDHFWIGEAGVVAIATTSGALLLPYGSSWFGLGVFASLSDPSKLLVTAPCEKVYGSSGFVGNAGSAYGSPAQRYWAYDDVWATRMPGSAGALVDPLVPSVNAGVRVAQAKLVLGGEVHAFNFGFVAASAVSDLQELTVDLIGEAQAYVAQRSMAPSNVNSAYLPAAAMCCPIVPWAE